MRKNPVFLPFFSCYALGLLFLLASGCSKINDPGHDADKSYFIRFKCNGVSKNYGANTVAQIYYDEENLVHRCNIIASLETLNTHDAMSFFLVAKEKYKTGTTYILRNEIEMAKNNAVMPQVTAVYMDENAAPYTAQFLPSDWYEFNDQAEVKFTEITDEYVKGTFSARVFTAMPERQELLITEGDFYLSVYEQ